MRNLSLLAAIAALSLAGGAAVAQEKPAKAAKEKKICKGEATSTSRIGKKTCRTKAEWDRMAGQEDLDDAASRLRGMTRGN
ncbi:MAG TPA: hypothetical protein VE053_11360 [Allosphingosinicella sp.]|nr:hypothetical protein [Allosphingosinicella sp.]